MPVMLHRLRAMKQVRQIPAIALTVFAKEENIKKSLYAGFQRHLTKPIEPAEVKTIIKVIVAMNAVTSQSAKK
jgi:CheY-like chemotaxis protein